MIIGITGTDGAGKGTVVDYLISQHNFTHYSSRSFIAKYVEDEGLPMTRNQLRLTANILREKFGNEFVVRQAYEQALHDKVVNAVIESIRAFAEAEYLKAQGGILLAVDADAEIRYARVQERRSATDQVSFETFVSHEKLEADDPNPHGMQKAKVRAMADFTLLNNTTHEDLYTQIEAVLAQISKS